MRIALPVESNDLMPKLYPSLGRSPFFFIYDTNTNEVFCPRNTAADSQGGSGIKAAQIIVDHHVEAVITPRCGERAAQVLQAAAIKLFKTIDGSVQENISALLGGKLCSFEDVHPGYHSGGK